MVHICKFMYYFWQIKMDFNALKKAPKLAKVLKIGAFVCFTVCYNLLGWSIADSNRLPQHCQCCALPDELIPRV